MRIKLHVIVPSLRFGGAERFCITLLQHLSREHFDVSLILMQAGGPLAAEIPPDIPVHILEARSVRTALIRLIGLIRRERPHLTLSTLGHLNLAIAMIRPLLPKGTRCLARAAASPSAEYTRLPPHLRDALVRRYYPKLDGIITQCQSVTDALIQTFNCPTSMIVTIPNPVDSDGIGRFVTTASRTTHPDVCKLVAAGRLDYQKGFDLLLEAFARLPDRFQLDILGDGPERGHLEAQAARLGLGARCRWQGFQANPIPYFVNADRFIFCSRYDAFPNAVLEAGACGLPVIGFRCEGGITEIIREGREGSLVPPAQPTALAEAIQRTETHPFDSEAIRTATRERFSIQTIIPRYESILRDTARRGRP